MTTSLSATDTLANTIEQKLVNSPYALERTEKGFNVAINLADAKWWLPLNRSGLKDTFVFSVVCDEAKKTYAVTDTQRRVSWKAGAAPGTLQPHFSMNFSYASGRIISRRREKQYGLSDAGKVGEVVDINFSSRYGADAIRSAADSLGWKEKMGTNQKIGLYTAVGAGIMALGILIAMIISLSLAK